MSMTSFILQGMGMFDLLMTGATIASLDVVWSCPSIQPLTWSIACHEKRLVKKMCCPVTKTEGSALEDGRQ